MGRATDAVEPSRCGGRAIITPYVGTSRPVDELVREGVTAMPEAQPSRRAVLAATGALAAGVLTGCTDDETPVPPDPDLVLRHQVADEIGELVRSYAAVTAAFPSLAPRLSPLAAEHEAHVAALRGPAGAARLPSPSGSRSTTPAPPHVPPTPAEATAWLARLERRAARRRARQALRAGPALARLLGSVSACESVHGVLLRRQP